MSNPSKLVIGLLTFFPLAHVMFFIGAVAYSFSEPTLLAGDGFSTLMVSHFASIFVNLGMMVFYVVHALTRNEAIEDQTHRLLWAIILFMGNMIATPVYYVLYILPDRRQQLA
jgi:hypothetical protein